MTVLACIAIACLAWAAGVTATFGITPALYTLLRRHGGRHAR